ncbi:hypothetical protein HKX48_005432 [Thoreauomyces humboldtii]|nr:hypothetical protein HKX48_005432 [Thoreauomyces humboldtii]
MLRHPIPPGFGPGFKDAVGAFQDGQPQRRAPVDMSPQDPADSPPSLVEMMVNEDDDIAAEGSESLEKDFPDRSPRAEDRLDMFAVALKTGVDVVHQRAPIQLMSYLKPIRNLIVIGDGEVQVGDKTMINVIGDRYGPRDKDPLLEGGQPKANPDSPDAEAVTVDEDSLGWKADGHKNLPGFQALWERYPKADWFLMIDDDTYVFFDNLADRLSMYNPDGKHYFGSNTQFVGCDGVQVWGAGPGFAHGGSGIVISRGAMKEMVEGLEGQDGCIEKYKTCWAGDVRTSLCLRDQGILLHSPDGFSSSPPNREYGFPHDPCERPLTFHHLLVKQTQDLYDVEKRVTERRGKGSVTFGDIFWDWHAETELIDDFDRKGGDYMAALVSNIEDCRSFCTSRKVCVAYSYDGSTCMLKDKIPGGKSIPGTSSGVLRERYTCTARGAGF